MRRAEHTSVRLFHTYSPFLVWVCVFCVGWFAMIQTQDLWDELRSHWPIALSMLFGSYVAGSTPMGGGTIGFPILVLLFDQPASLGRVFSFCIQSVGMTSASIFIFCRRIPIAHRVLFWSVLTGYIVVPLTLHFIAPHVNGEVVKLVFASIWGSFGILSLVKLREFAGSRVKPKRSNQIDMIAGTIIGTVGGVAAGLTGVGIDMILYCVLMLAYRSDARTAIASSVVLMAITSWCGVVWSAVLGHITQEVYHNWIAAAPVVLFGAPLGAAVVAYVPRKATMFVVSLLCIGQLVWTIQQVGITMQTVLGVLIALLAINGAFHLMHVWGKRRAAANPEPSDSGVGAPQPSAE